VSAVSESWLEVKNVIYNSLRNTEDNSSEKIDDFTETFHRFFASPVGALYEVHVPEEMHALEHVSILTEQLKSALQDKNTEEIFSLIITIDSSINLLQNIDTRLSDTTQRNYFYLFFSFTILIITIIAAMTFLYRNLEKSQESEQRSITFSRETVKAQEEERSRIAKELHDTVAQDLWRLTFQTDSIGKTENTEERLRLCNETVHEERELMKRIRNICDTLIPPDFTRRGLIDALRLLCYNFEQRTGVTCKTIIEESLNLGELESSAQLQCFRIAQECLANIEKHSGATESSVFIKTQHDNTLVISIRDNGKGFLPPDRESSQQFKDEGHIGLWSLFERAA
jgi:signal transduction histidine kinase